MNEKNTCNGDFCEIPEDYFQQNGEEITPEMLAELSNGKGDDENE